MVTKKEIEMARKRYYLKEAQKQLGSKIKSLSQVEIIREVKKPKFSLGKTIQMKADKAYAKRIKKRI